MRFDELNPGMTAKEIRDSYAAYLDTLPATVREIKKTPNEPFKSYWAWKAAEINKLFRNYGLGGKSGSILPETIKNGCTVTSFKR